MGTPLTGGSLKLSEDTIRVCVSHAGRWETRKLVQTGREDGVR